jgi:hypothetical protein
VTKMRESEWRPSISLDQGLTSYAAWVETYLNSAPLR